MLVEHTDDFVGLDTVTANLDLVVDTPQKRDIAVGQKTAEVSCFVEPAAWFGAERVRNKLLTGEVGAVVIAPRQTRAPYVNFARRTREHRMKSLIQEVDFCVGDGMADVRLRGGAL